MYPTAELVLLRRASTYASCCLGRLKFEATEVIIISVAEVNARVAAGAAPAVVAVPVACAVAVGLAEEAEAVMLGSYLLLASAIPAARDGFGSIETVFLPERSRVGIDEENNTGTPADVAVTCCSRCC